MNPEQWLSLKWNGGSTMSDRWLNQSKIIQFYNKDYYEEINYLFDSLVNGYHINMSTEEVETYCYQLCNYVLKRIEGEHV